MAPNNFDFLRLIFALFVLITHSYPLSGAVTGDFLSEITKGQVSLSYIGICGFFIISGYLVIQSLNNSSSLLGYFRKRALRIYPALFVMLLLCVILGYFVYESDLSSYLRNKSMWTYLPNRLSFIFLQDEIDGIFTHNIYGRSINGSLWSLLYEVSFYSGLAALFFFNKSTQLKILTGILALLLFLRLFFHEESRSFNFVLEAYIVLEYAPFFLFGSWLALVNVKQWKYQYVLFGLCSLMLALSLVLNVYDYVKYFTLPIIVIVGGLGSIPVINRFIEKMGDISYGVYIYAFPIQQTLMHYFQLSAIELMISALPLACVFGFLSWQLIEKRALTYRR